MQRPPRRAGLLDSSRLPVGPPTVPLRPDDHPPASHRSPLAHIPTLAANACSGHGLCRLYDECSCEPNYYGADCSLRVCPYDFAFVDTPAGDLNHDGLVSGDAYIIPMNTLGASNVPQYEMFPTDASRGFYQAQQDEAHFYMECSGKGTCDQATGQCVCFTGYTGSACQRSESSPVLNPLLAISVTAVAPHSRLFANTHPFVISLFLSICFCPAGTCPGDCNGQGLCRTLREVATGALSRRAIGGKGGNLELDGVRTAFDYSLWDADKHQMCVCDAGFDGIDCSQRTCPRGDDPLSPQIPRWCGGVVCADEVQSFQLSSAGSSTYKFTFVDMRNTTLVAYFTVDTAIGLPGAVANPALEIAGPTTNAGIIMAAIRALKASS